MKLRLILLVSIVPVSVAAQTPPRAATVAPLAPLETIETCQPQPDCRVSFLRGREPARLPDIVTRGIRVPEELPQGPAGGASSTQAPSR